MRSSTVTCFYFRDVFISIFLRMISGKKLIRPSREIQIPSGAARFTKDRYHYLPLPFFWASAKHRGVMVEDPADINTSSSPEQDLDIGFPFALKVMYLISTFCPELFTTFTLKM